MRRILAIASAALLSSAAGVSAQTYQLVTSWNAPGGSGIAVDAAGDVYVAGGTEVAKFDPTGAPMGGFVTASNVQSIVVAADGSVFLLAVNHDILHYDASGGLLSTWTGLAEGYRGIAVDAASTVYVFAFVEGYQIRRISSAGVAMGEFGAFDIPQAITVGTDGSVYGTDGEPNRPAVHKFEPVSGAQLTAWGDGFAPRDKGESGDGEFHTPIAISVFGGRVFVVDGGNSRVQVFDETGAFLTKWSTTAIGGVAVDANGNVYLYGAGKVEKWALSSQTPVRSATWGEVKARWR